MNEIYKEIRKNPATAPIPEKDSEKYRVCKYLVSEIAISIATKDRGAIKKELDIIIPYLVRFPLVFVAFTGKEIYNGLGEFRSEFSTNKDWIKWFETSEVQEFFFHD